MAGARREGPRSALLGWGGAGSLDGGTTRSNRPPARRRDLTLAVLEDLGAAGARTGDMVSVQAQGDTASVYPFILGPVAGGREAGRTGG